VEAGRIDGRTRSLASFQGAVKQRLVLHEVFLKLTVEALHGCPRGAHLKGLFGHPLTPRDLLALGRLENKTNSAGPLGTLEPIYPEL
jgi:hypothetical protein